MNNLNIQVGEIYKKYPEGTTFEVIAKDFKDDYKNDIAIAVFNGKLRELSKMPDCDGNLEFLDLASGTGHRA